MAAALDVRQNQHALIELMWFYNETVTNIHKRLKKMYGDGAVDHSTVIRWASRISGESGHVNVKEFPRSDRPHTAQTPDNMRGINNLNFAGKTRNRDRSWRRRSHVCRILKWSYKNSGNEIWLRHFESEKKRQSMEWHHTNSPYIPDMPLCYYHLICKLKESLRGMR